MSEALWYLTRSLPENHALMISLGEGQMPKGGESREMGSNPLLGFGRVYARPVVAKVVDGLVRRLINDQLYGWTLFWEDIQRAGITIWGAAVDTLENTTRFAEGALTGPMSVIHVFDQPLSIALPYEGYMGCLTLPQAVVDTAEKESILINYLTPRAKVLEALRLTYDVRAENVHVWTLHGKSRKGRIGGLWAEWRRLGVHVVEDGWLLPNGRAVFTDSGTYAAVYQVGPFRGVDNKPHAFICDGYAASAEAVQAASLDPLLQVRTSMLPFSSEFEVSWDREWQIMLLDSESSDFTSALTGILGRAVDQKDASMYRDIVRNARDSNLPLGKRSTSVDDFFPKKYWRSLALSSAILNDPYSRMNSVEGIPAL